MIYSEMDRARSWLFVFFFWPGVLVDLFSLNSRLVPRPAFWAREILELL